MYNNFNEQISDVLGNIKFNSSDEFNLHASIFDSIRDQNEDGKKIIEYIDQMVKKSLDVIEAYIYSQKKNKIPLLTKWGGSQLKQIGSTHEELIKASKIKEKFEDYIKIYRENKGKVPEEKKISDYDKIINFASFNQIKDEDLVKMVKNLKFQRISNVNKVSDADIEREVNSRFVRPYIGLYGSNGPIDFYNIITDYFNINKHNDKKNLDKENIYFNPEDGDRSEVNYLAKFRQGSYFLWLIPALLSEIIEIKNNNPTQFKDILGYLESKKNWQLNVDFMEEIDKLEPKTDRPMFRIISELEATRQLRKWNEKIEPTHYDLKNPPKRLGVLDKSEKEHYERYNGDVYEGRNYFSGIDKEKQSTEPLINHKYNKIILENDLPQISGISTSAFRAFRVSKILGIDVDPRTFIQSQSAFMLVSDHSLSEIVCGSIAAGCKYNPKLPKNLIDDLMQPESKSGKIKEESLKKPMFPRLKNLNINNKERGRSLP